MFNLNKNIVSKSTIKAEGNVHVGDVILNTEPLYPKIQIFEKPKPDYISRQIFQYQSILQTQTLNFSQKQSYDIIEVLEQHKRIVLIGDAGMGKSTEVKRICYDLQKNELYYPVLKILGNYRRPDSDLPVLPHFQIPTEYIHEQGKFVLIIDGLDESDIGLAKQAIDRFASDFPDAKILVSCRSNAYSNTLQNFEVYYLGKLAYTQIQQYIQKKLGSFSVTFLEYWRKKYHWNQNQLIDNPFFLVRICEFVQENNNHPPDSLGEVFEYLIDKCLDLRLKSVSRFGSGSYEPLRKSCRQSLEKLAFVMECKGDNVISEMEFTVLIPNPDEQEILLVKSSLLEPQGNAWRFAHNNFQEYLAAKALSRAKSFTTIKKAVAAKPDFQRLKWTWVNALSFLMGLCDDDNPKKKQLLDWLAKDDLEPLIKIGSLEKDTIPQADRERIFKIAFENSKNEDLIIGSHHYNYWDLAEFGESIHSVNYLTEELKNAKTPTIKANALLLLKSMQRYFVARETKGELRKLLKENIFDFAGNTPANRHFAMEASFHLFEISDDEAEKIIDTFFNSDNAQERTSTYSLIDKKQFYVKYMEPLIRRTVELNENQWRETRLLDESLYLKRCFENLDSEEELVCFFEAYPKAIEDVNAGMTNDLPINQVLLKVNELTISKNGVSRIFNAMKQRFYEWFAYNNALENLVSSFIEKYDFKKAFFQYIISMRGVQMVAVEFFDADDAPYLTKKLQEGLLDWEYLNHFINWVSFRKNDAVKSLVNSLNEVAEKPFCIPESKPVVTPKERMQLHKEKILFEKRLFLDQPLCRSTIEELFSVIGKEKIAKSEIWEILRDSKIEQTNILEKYPNSFLHFVNGAPEISKQGLLKTINEKWDWISINQTKEYLKKHKKEIESDPELDLNSNEIEIIKTWCNNHHSKMNLEKSATNGDIIFAWFVIHRKFTYYPKKTYLMMAGSNLQNYLDLNLLDFILEQKVVPFNELKDQILGSMEITDVGDWRLYSYLKFIETHQVTEALPVLPRFIEYTYGLSDYRNQALKTFIALDGDKDYLLDLLENISFSENDYREQTLLDHFSTRNNKTFEKILIQKLASSSNPEHQLKYARCLLRQHSLVGLQFLEDYIIREKKSPFSLHFGNRDYLFENPTGIPILLRFFDYASDPAIPQDNFNSILMAGRNIFLHLAACQNQRFFELVRAAIIEYLDAHTSLNEVVERKNEYLSIAHPEALTQLRYLLKDLEFNRYQKQEVTIEEAVETWENLK